MPAQAVIPPPAASVLNYLSYWKRGPSGFGYHSTAEDVTQGLDLSTRTAIITGPTSGIGRECARVLALHGANVILAARNIKAAEEVKNYVLEQKSDANIGVLEINLSSLSSVRKAAQEFISRKSPLHILINNAGALVPKFMKSEDGFEMQFATNHLGHFLLTKLLLDNMKKTSENSGIEGRIVNVSSQCYKFAKEGIPFDKLTDPSSNSTKYPLGYGVSKLANILHAKELSKRLKEQNSNITANVLHPGVIPTNILHLTPDYFSYAVSCTFSNQVEVPKSIPKGAATTCYVATNPGLVGVSGEYFLDCNQLQCVSHANDMNLAHQLWEFSDKVTQ